MNRACAAPVDCVSNDGRSIRISNPKREKSMSRATIRRLVVALSIVAFGFTASGPVCRAEDAVRGLPIYRLEVGQELTYKDDNEMKRGDGPRKSGYSFHTDWKASVVGTNQDGSYRIVIRSAQKMTFDGNAAGRAHTTFGYCDVF